MIEKTGEGVVAMITAHGYLDNPTFRGMRWHLMQTFDEIRVLDLHGNANKKEKSPDGGEDKNVFDIMTGVSILVGVKHKNTSADNLATVFRADCFGARELKFDFLEQNSLDTISWQKLRPSAPNYEWTARDDEVGDEYKKGFSVAELFTVSSVGIVTSRDDFVIDMDRSTLIRRIEGFTICDTPKALSKYSLKENLKWKAAQAMKHHFDEKSVVTISYRPFDLRSIYYHDDFIERSRKEAMKHMLLDNIGLVVRRQMPEDRTTYFFISNNALADGYIRSDNKGSESILPLYLYADDGSKYQTSRESSRKHRKDRWQDDARRYF